MNPPAQLPTCIHQQENVVCFFSHMLMNSLLKWKKGILVKIFHWLKGKRILLLVVKKNCWQKNSIKTSSNGCFCGLLIHYYIKYFMKWTNLFSEVELCVSFLAVTLKFLYIFHNSFIFIISMRPANIVSEDIDLT